MNFDEIKNSMELEQDNLPIPLSLTDLKHSQNAIGMIRKSMVTESIFRTVGILFLLFFPLSNKLQDNANGIYICSILIFSAIAVQYMVKFLNFIRENNHVSHNSKDALQAYFSELTTVLAIYRTAGIASTISLILPTTILILGNKYTSPETINNFMSLNYSSLNILAGGLCFVALIFLINWNANKWSKYSYEKYAKRIKLILDQYKD